MGKTISRMLRAGSRTYFFDLKKAKTGKRYLMLTESRWAEDGKERQRNSIILFPEQAAEFATNVSELTAKLA